MNKIKSKAVGLDVGEEKIKIQITVDWTIDSKRNWSLRGGDKFQSHFIGIGSRVARVSTDIWINLIVFDIKWNLKSQYI